MGRRRIFILIAGLALLAAVGCKALQEDLSAILDPGGSDGSLDEGTVAAGIKEALRVGTGNTVLSTSSIDGFLANELIRIAIPDQLQPVMTTLRRAGFGGSVDELETGMNRAAERAAGEARSIFLAAIADMTLGDAFAILRGHDTAATDYFRDKTSLELRRRFHPIVIQKMDEVGLSRLYKTMADTYNAIPVPGKTELVDLDEYVTDRAMDGLFTVLAGEERKIRSDPAARTTELLKKVFGR